MRPFPWNCEQVMSLCWKYAGVEGMGRDSTLFACLGRKGVR